MLLIGIVGIVLFRNSIVLFDDRKVVDNYFLYELAKRSENELLTKSKLQQLT